MPNAGVIGVVAKLYGCELCGTCKLVMFYAQFCFCLLCRCYILCFLTPCTLSLNPKFWIWSCLVDDGGLTGPVSPGCKVERGEFTVPPSDVDALM